VKLYIETSVPNFLFVTDAPEKRQATEQLFEQLRTGEHQGVVSDLYLREVHQTPSPLLLFQLEGVIEVYKLERVNTDAETLRIARAYIAGKAFTENNFLDALHVAAGVQHGCEVVVSWNFQHIVRAWTIKQVAEVNAALGLANIVICTPQEVIGDDPAAGGVRQVREWRHQVAEAWCGKSDAEILEDLEATQQLYDKKLARREDDRALRSS
jgi:hypothetical protein